MSVHKPLKSGFSVTHGPMVLLDVVLINFEDQNQKANIVGTPLWFDIQELLCIMQGTQPSLLQEIFHVFNKTSDYDSPYLDWGFC